MTTSSSTQKTLIQAYKLPENNYSRTIVTVCTDKETGRYAAFFSTHPEMYGEGYTEGDAIRDLFNFYTEHTSEF